MKHYLMIALMALPLLGKAQNAGVEKSIFGVQTGLLGIWFQNESKLTNTIALRSELGFDTGIWGGSAYDKTGVMLTPILSLEPRLYYNLGKRLAKSRKTDNNTGNYVSLKLGHHPKGLEISNYNNVDVTPDLSIIPTWGIRRHIGKHICFETGAGIGYRYLFAKSIGNTQNESKVTVNIHLRLGWTF